MNDHSQYRRVSLPDYLIEQRCGADHAKQIDLYAKIYCGELKAFYTPPSPAPVDLDWKMRLLRHGFNEPAPMPTPIEIPAMERLKIKTEVGKAARGMDADRSLLDSIVLEIPVDMPANNEPEVVELLSDDSDTTATKSVVKKFSPTQQARAELILHVIKRLGLLPDALEPPEANGGGGDRAKIRAEIPLKTMAKNAFKNAWNYMLDNEIVSYKKI